MKIASIDIGTNTILLLVAEWNGGKNGGERTSPLRVLHDEVRIVRLGERLHEKKVFIPEAQERVLQALKDYKSICDRFGVEKIAAVGTAAFRKAGNAREFVGRIEREVGIKVAIISGEEEARLSYLSVERDFGHLGNNLVALDIGGGSTEIISKEGGASFDVGAVILTESIVRHDPVTKEEFRAMEKNIDHVVGADLVSALEKRANAGFRANTRFAPTLIGLAGSVTTLSAIKQKLTVWDGAKVQGSVLTQQDIEEMLALFRRTTNEERRTIPGMVKGREDTILAGTLILQKVMEKMGVDQVTVSDRGLRYGLLYGDL